ncbi:hypothetical protein [uncultured Pontibacter sp.]|uniref:hypothetical protein n=1 Tax=uncultured Pontibacter sp. TaxID=453356 RepID=UPI0026305E77|nr:hypothetical protein [uncultured Pontibacter sp.]
MHPTNLNAVSEEKLVYWVVKTALVLFFISDVLNRILIYYEFDFSASLYVRGFYELVFISIIAVYSNRSRTSFFITILILFCFFAAGIIAFSLNYPDDFNTLFHLSVFNKYIFVFIIYQAINSLKNKPTYIDNLVALLENIFVLNSVIVIIGAAFQIDLLRSYPGERSLRFGYIGFIPAVNEATLFYLIGLSLAYYRRYILNIETKKFYVIVVASLLLGTKAIYLIIVSLLLLHLARTSKFKTKVYVISTILILAFAVKLYLGTPDAQVRFNLFYRLANEYGIMSMLLSSRDILLQTRFLANTDYWGIVNYLFGGQNQLRFLIEMDLFDMMLFFGIIGSILYLSLFFSSLFTFKKNRYFNLYFILIYFTIAALGGHFFASALNALYLALAVLYIKSSQKSVPLLHN